MRKVGFAFAVSGLLFAAWPAAAAEWVLEKSGVVGEGEWARNAIIRMEDGSSLGALCTPRGIMVLGSPADAAETDFFLPTKVTWSFDGGPGKSADWEGRYMFLDWTGRDEEAEVDAFVSGESPPPDQVAEVAEFVRGLAGHGGVSLDFAGETQAVFSLKGSSAPVKAVLAACGY